MTPFVGRYFNMTRAGIHADGLLKEEEIYNIFNTRKLLNRPRGRDGQQDQRLGRHRLLDQRKLRPYGENAVQKHDPLVQNLKAWVDEMYEGGPHHLRFAARTGAQGGRTQRRTAKQGREVSAWNTRPSPSPIRYLKFSKRTSSPAFTRAAEILTKTKLSEKLGVSRTPIREALRRLEQERLVVGTSRGMRVVGLDMKDIEDIYEIRSRVEGLAARRAAERAKPEWLEELKRVLDMQEFFTIKEDGDSIIDADNHFHDMLYRLSGSLVLYDTLAPLHRKIVRYRKVSIGHAGRAKESYAEHKAIYEAVAAHDPDEAERLVLLHMVNARNSIRSTEVK